MKYYMIELFNIITYYYIDLIALFLIMALFRLTGKLCRRFYTFDDVDKR